MSTAFVNSSAGSLGVELHAIKASAKTNVSVLKKFMIII
jgi:hypothetical protein